MFESIISFLREQFSDLGPKVHISWKQTRNSQKNLRMAEFLNTFCQLCADAAKKQKRKRKNSTKCKCALNVSSRNLLVLAWM